MSNLAIVSPDAAVDSALTSNPKATIKIIGAGGAGRNIVSNMLMKVVGAYVSCDLYDTAKDDISDNNVIIYSSDSSGSGKDRTVNADRAKNFISNLKDDVFKEDIHIVVCSGAGGSGGVFGPYYAAEAIRRKKRAILVVIIDIHSKKDTTNSEGTLATIDRAITETGENVPIMLFDNCADIGLVQSARHKTNIAVVESLTGLVVAYTCAANGLDRMDRIKSLELTKLLKVSPGVSLLNVTTGTDPVRPGEFTPTASVDNIATSVLAVLSDDNIVLPKAHLSYEGVYSQRVDPSTGAQLKSVIVTISPIKNVLNSIVGLIDSTKHKFETASTELRNTSFGVRPDDDVI